MDLITVFGGRRPLIREMLLANVEQDGWVAMAEKKNPTPGSTDAIKWLRNHAPSLDGFRSKQVVEIARSESAPVSQSILDVLKRGRNK